MTRAQILSPQPQAARKGFQHQLDQFSAWREELVELINEYQNWVEQQGLSSGEEDLRTYELLDQLRADKLTIALVAEFSRGKTELINAIFFADHRQRLLPSDAGRTTMCPTELRFDESDPPCLKLLPIETRDGHLTIAEHRRSKTHWTVLPLAPDDPQQLTETFKELVRTKNVKVADAERLGLYQVAATNGGQLVNEDGTVAIPQWRHAIINFPHPLLKQGLVVLDTPGLNSLGTEPELTLSMLPAAQAVLFVLAADTGVTKSDLEVWTNHVCVAKHQNPEARLVALNKIDALWDDLRAEGAFEAMLARQVHETAKILGISQNQVFPLSAQKALLAKIKGDAALLTRSGLPALEQTLAGETIAAKQTLLQSRVRQGIGDLIHATRAMVEARLAGTDTELKELRALSGMSEATIHKLIAHMREEKENYDKTLTSFQATRVVLTDQIKILLGHLSMETFDATTSKTREGLNESWTTRGLRTGMKTLFDGLLDAMEKANKQALQVRQLLQAVYTKFHIDHGLAKTRPNAFSLLPYRSQLQRLYDEAEAFRNSPAMVMTEQRFVIKKFFITLVSRARLVFSDCNRGGQAWARAILAPVLVQIKEHKLMMERRLESLKKVHENHDNLATRLAECESRRQQLESQLTVISNMLRKLDQPASLNS